MQEEGQLMKLISFPPTMPAVENPISCVREYDERSEGRLASCIGNPFFSLLSFEGQLAVCFPGYQ
jgi:hypothetical protein